ncbi:ATP-binding protein [Candidatus Woesearchaeota archaeon]|nr:ATP-binding protein [Candidatus Woesearchaeota archaeon]
MVRGQPDFVLDWEKALGFKGDPFADKILLPASKFMVNREMEKEKINWFFIKGFLYGKIIGNHGVGKTTLLKWLEERLKKYERIHSVYINAGVFKEQINIPHQILLPLLSFYEKHVSKPHTKMINFDFVNFLKAKLQNKSVTLLIDNAHHLTDRNLELIKSMREDGLPLQIIITSNQAEYEKSRLSELGHDELDIQLRRLTLEESKEVIQRRVESFGGKGIEPLSDEIVRELYDKADKNTRQFIHFCRDEAIKRLIHKQELLENASREEASGSAGGYRAPYEDELDMMSRSRASASGKNGKKKLFNIKFDRSNSKPKEEQTPLLSKRIFRRESTAAPNASSGKPLDERQAMYNDRYKQDLLDQLNRPNLRRKFKRDKKESFNEINRIIDELSDEKE